MWIPISWNELYLILYHSLNLTILWQTSIFRKFRLKSWLLIYRNGICYRKLLKWYTGNVRKNCHHLFFWGRTVNYSISMTKKDFCKIWHVHTTLNNGETFCRLSKFSLKAVLLYNRYIHPSIPITHSVHMKETHKIWICSWQLQVTQNMDGKYVETFMS
jgi:hypothetical protein